MFEYFLIGWVVVALMCEVYLYQKVKNSYDESTWPDDESKNMTRHYSSIANNANVSKRRAIRVTYLAVPTVAAFFMFLV